MYMHYARACLFLFMMIAYACSVWTWTDVCAIRARIQKTWESLGQMEMAECQDVTGARVCVMLNMLGGVVAAVALAIQTMVIIESMS